MFKFPRNFLLEKNNWFWIRIRNQIMDPDNMNNRQIISDPQHFTGAEKYRFPEGGAVGCGPGLERTYSKVLLFSPWVTYAKHLTCFLKNSCQSWWYGLLNLTKFLLFFCHCFVLFAVNYSNFSILAIIDEDRSWVPTWPVSSGRRARLHQVTRGNLVTC